MVHTRKPRSCRVITMASCLLAMPAGEFTMERQLENIRLLTLSEAAALLQVSTRTLQRMIRQRQLPAFKVGGQWRMRESQLSEWLEQKERSARGD
jgi:excisionase family DNA binding protein